MQDQCNVCNAIMDPDAIFCNECGAASAAVSPAASATGTIQKTDSRDCPNCGKSLKKSVRFCSGCGHDLTSVIKIDSFELKCPGCQKLYVSDDKFCRHCAYDLSKVVKRSSAVFCTDCGQPFDQGDAFCRHCAADISKSAHTVAVPIVGKSAIPRMEMPQSPVSAPPASHSPVASTPQHNEEPVFDQKGPHWVSPSAAAFVVICFFLPWLEWSCFGTNIPVSGAKLADYDGSLWLFPLAAIVTIAVYFIFKSQGRLWKARPFILISSGFALLLLLYKVNNVPSGDFMGMRYSAADLGIRPQIGAFGTVLGFIVAIFGCIFLGRSTVWSSDWLVPPSRESSGQIETLMQKVERIKPEKAAMLCYLTPLVIPLSVQLLYTVLALIIWSSVASQGLVLIFGFIAFAIQLASLFVPQIVFLKKEPLRTVPLVRFHAYQSLILVGSSIALSIGLLVLAVITSVSPSMSPFFFYTLVLVQIAYLGLMIFCSVKANRGEIYKVPYIGDWAERFAARPVKNV